MCFSKAASKIPKGEQMPKLTVLVCFRPDHQGELCQGFTLDPGPGNLGTDTQNIPAAGRCPSEGGRGWVFALNRFLSIRIFI